MSDTLQFELVTPERLAVSEAVAMVEVPGEMGDFGVLPGHAPFLSMIRPGVIAVHREAESTPVRYFVPSGYAEVNPDGCIVLAEQIRDLAELTRDLAESELAVARKTLEMAEDRPDIKQAEKAVARAEALLEAVQALR